MAKLSKKALKRKRFGSEHMYLPDGQVRKGVNTDHWEAAGNYAADKRPDVIINAGDFADMPSLNSHEKKWSKYFQDQNYRQDIEAAAAAMERFLAPIRKVRGYKPRLVLTLGNHENRIVRATNEDPVLDGALSLDDLPYQEWEVYPYLDIVEIDKILYSHVFLNPTSLVRGPLTGTVDNRLNKIKQSFTQGHQQVRLWGSQFTSGGREICGLVAGAFYSHQEDYQGPQGNNYWRGAVYKHEVKDGRYDPMMLSLGYLIREWL